MNNVADVVLTGDEVLSAGDVSKDGFPVALTRSINSGSKFIILADFIHISFQTFSKRTFSLSKHSYLLNYEKNYLPFLNYLFIFSCIRSVGVTSSVYFSSGERADLP